MLIGYSFWGFLGPGVLDTPDGGRSHRRTLIDGLRARGHDVVFLQADRDLLEAGHNLTSTYRWDDGFPEIDALFLEWRWPIPARNTTPCGAEGHTCDLHRQQDLLDHYTLHGVRTIIWDKDLRQAPHDPVRTLGHVVTCEAALHPSSEAISLLFPIDDMALDTADPASLAGQTRDLDLAYVGNQYDRDDMFDHFFAPAAAQHRHLVAGKWTRTMRWPRVRFAGRMPFTEVPHIYGRAVTTMLLLPQRYAIAGQMTQRIIEAVTAGCLPLTPAPIHAAEVFAPAQLHITDGAHASRLITGLCAMVGTDRHIELLADCLHRLEIFRLSRQLDILDTLLAPRHTAGLVS